MKHFVVISLVILMTSCATFQEQTLSQAKEDLDCIKYKEGINWGRISEKFGDPYIAPLPEPGTDLIRNTRVYKDKVIIFYTEMQEVKEMEKVRFYEVVTNIEICKEK